FEERTAKQEEQYKKEFEAQGMKPEEAAKAAQMKACEQIEKTYKNMEKLLEVNPKAPVNDRDRAILAEQCMQHAADPLTISQGDYNTCNVTTVETRTYTRSPAEATRLVADMATSGKYQTNGTPPVTVELDKSLLSKQGESTKIPHVDGCRDYASQVFQVTAVNIHYSKENLIRDPKGQVRYEQRESKDGARPADNG